MKKNPCALTVGIVGMCIALVNVDAAAQTSEVTIALVPRARAGVDDTAPLLPESQTDFQVGGMVVELWAQTSAPNGLAQVSVDFEFPQDSFTVNAVTHTAPFSLFATNTIDNPNGIVDDLSGSVFPVTPPCSGAVGATPQWARVAIIDIVATAVGAGSFVIGPTNNAVFVNAICGSIDPPPVTFLGASVTVALAQGADVTIALVPRAVAGLDDTLPALPAPETELQLDDAFVVEVWAQTPDPDGLAQVSAELAFPPNAITATTITHTSLFPLFEAGFVDSATGRVVNLSGSVAPVSPPCGGAVGAEPQWARVAIVDMQITRRGPTRIINRDTNNPVFTVANCGTFLPPDVTYLSATVNVPFLEVPAASNWGLAAMAIILVILGIAKIRRVAAVQVVR